MLNNIRLHVEKDEDKQVLLEKKLANYISDIHKKNLQAFQRQIPSLLPYIQTPSLKNISIFCNKFGEINLLDYGTGRTLYGAHPTNEVKAQCASFHAHAAYIQTDSNFHEEPRASETQPVQYSSISDLPAYQYYCQSKPLPNDAECAVILGCGLGLHIEELIKKRKIKHLIVYEPEPQYFQCSAITTKWYEILKAAREKGTAIYFQIEKDGRNIIDDIAELQQHFNISGFYLYRHYNHAVFNSLYKELTSKSWKSLKSRGISFNFSESYVESVPPWTATIDIEQYSDCDRQSARFQQNLSAFKNFFPDIYEEFKDYLPQVWMPAITSSGQVNIIKADSLTPWYSETPREDCITNYENYSAQPNRDGLVLGYEGEKLAHYLHYEFVKKTEGLIEQADDEVGELPDNIASIIMFGIGVGYQLDHMLKQHTIEKLFICEPNRDFFFASLFAIDWKEIFEAIEANEARIYLNIGDDGSNLFNDLLSQFHSIGPYILNNTYFYQSYYNSSLNTAIAQLREQLQIVISMGEYFDHAYYGIAHTREGFRRNIPVLTSSPSEHLSYDDKEVPVFIIGNGPSLDNSINAIKEWQDKAIIISCGTALQALHRNQITPDFHAEIEQNRSTYDWAVMIGDLDYLKQITLISCNGIHPDTCNVYKDVMVAFKEGESSTVSALSVLGKQHFKLLEYAFPTVCNFVTDIIRAIEFNHIYFMGVDLGFVDVKHHHSKSSGYYREDGAETFDYSEKNNTSIIVPGNFRSTVQTKYEFKISRQIIEQVISTKSREQEFYNCSDGAKIVGATPLFIENVLIVSSNTQKQKVLERLKTDVFTTKYCDGYIKTFDEKFSNTVLLNELSEFSDLLRTDIATDEQANELINKQKELLFSSYQNGRSLLFYYLYGTSNYASALLTKLLHSDQSDKYDGGMFSQILSLWREMIAKVTALVSRDIQIFDTSFFKIHEREVRLIKGHVKTKKLLVVTDSKGFVDSVVWLLKNYFCWGLSVTTCTFDKLDSNLTNQFDFVIYNYLFYFPNEKSLCPIMGLENTVFSVFDISHSEVRELCANNSNVTFVPFAKYYSSGRWMCDQLTVAAMLVNCCAQGHNAHIVLPKYKINKEIDLDYFGQQLYSPDMNEMAFDYPLFLAISSTDLASNIAVLNNGTRGTLIVEKLNSKHHIQEALAPIDFSERVEKFAQLVPTTLEEN